MAYYFTNCPAIGGRTARRTSAFGKRNTGITGASTFHKGIDLVHAPSATCDITAVFTGEIVVAIDTDGKTARGCFVKTSVGSYNVIYQHLKLGSIPAHVRPGVTLKQGEKVGYMGNTGTGSGAHLHFEMINNATDKAFSVNCDPILQGSGIFALETSDHFKTQLLQVSLGFKEQSEIDGSFGKNTKSKLITAYQKNHNLALTGSLNTDTINCMKANNLKETDNSVDAMLLNGALAGLRYYTGTYLTYTFTAHTKEALKELQRKNGLTVDGVCGSNTWKKILSSTVVKGDS